MRHLTAAFLATLAIGSVACSEGDPTGPANLPPGEVLILHDDSTHVQVTAILEDAGFNVTDGGRYDAYDGADLGVYDLVIFLDGYEYDLGMSDAGQQGLLDFAAGGGVLLVTEWLAYNIYFGDYPVLSPALPLVSQNGYCDNGGGQCIETYTPAAVHPVIAGIPTSFATPTDWTYSELMMNVATTSSNPRALFNGSGSGVALAVADRGAGHIFQWNMGGVYGGDDIWDANTEQILVNIAEFSRVVP